MTGMEAKLQAIREEYEQLIDVREQGLQRAILSIEAWARANPDEFPAGRKSIETVHGTIGFRTGTPKVQKGKKFSSLEKVAAFMRTLPWARKYVKTAALSVNKEALIADRGTLTAAQLNSVGLSITQDETFYIDPKAEPLTNGATVS